MWDKMSAVWIPPIDASEAVTILRPEGSSEGYWVGAPSAHTAGGQTYLAVRKRTPQDRGHTVVIYEQTGMTAYDPIFTVGAADVGAESLERPAILMDPETGDWKFYLSADSGSNEWSVLKLTDAPSPRTFDASTARPVLEPKPGSTDCETVKDPCVLHHGDRYYMFYAGYDGRSEQAHLATSIDGETWTRASGNPVLGRRHWHDYHTRVTAIVPAQGVPGWLAFYDGSGTGDYRNAWNLRTGVAITRDLESAEDVSTSGPVYTAGPPDGRPSTEGYATFRYVEVLEGDDEWTVFFEVARDDNAFELRQATVTVDG